MKNVLHIHLQSFFFVSLKIHQPNLPPLLPLLTPQPLPPINILRLQSPFTTTGHWSLTTIFFKSKILFFILFYFIFAWGIRKYEKVVKKICFPYHFQKCNQTIENIFFFLKKIYGRKIFLVKTKP